jgi:uncharacterized protein YjbI with pentapeptide repeats
MKIHLRPFSPWLRWTLSILVAIAILYIFWYDLVDTFFHKGKDDPSGELLKVVLTAAGGILLFMTYNATLKRAKAAEDTAKSQLEGNQIQRFNQAIEHLGNGSPTVRMGGIYTLHGIAFDIQKNQGSREEIKRICDILCSYVRDQARLEQPLSSFRDLSPIDEVKYLDRPASIDIQAVLNLLFKQPDANLYFEFLKDLHSTNLTNINLSEAVVHNTILNRSLMYNTVFGGSKFSSLLIHQGLILKTIFTECQFENSEFSLCIIKDGHFQENSFSGVKFLKSDFTQIDFDHSTLEIVDFSQSNFLNSIILTQCKITNSIFSSVHAFRTNFAQSIINQTGFHGSVFMDSIFNYTKLESVSFHGANLENSNLDHSQAIREVDFDDTSLKSCAIIDADLSGAISLTIEQLLRARSLHRSTGLSEETLKALKEKKPELFQNPVA